VPICYYRYIKTRECVGLPSSSLWVLLRRLRWFQQITASVALEPHTGTRIWLTPVITGSKLYTIVEPNQTEPNHSEKIKTKVNKILVANLYQLVRQSYRTTLWPTSTAARSTLQTTGQHDYNYHHHYPAPGRGTGYCFRVISLFLCQQHCKKTAGPICMKFSGKVWSDYGTTWLHFGSIRDKGQFVCYHRP